MEPLAGREVEGAHGDGAPAGAYWPTRSRWYLPRWNAAAGDHWTVEDIAIRMHYNGSVLRKVRDSTWSADHIAAHDVTLDEVREAILERPYWSAPGRDGTTLIYGRTYEGRYLFVVAIAEGEEAFIVTARDMTDTERRTFRRKAR
jgi:uncharacterized protein